MSYPFSCFSVSYHPASCNIRQETVDSLCNSPFRASQCYPVKCKSVALRLKKLSYFIAFFRHSAFQLAIVSADATTLTELNDEFGQMWVHLLLCYVLQPELH